MPRRWIERLVDWDPLQEGIWYVLMVLDVDKSSEPPGMRVKLLFQDAPHMGRVHEAVLLVPGRPSGPTIEFVRSTGLKTASGTFAPRDAIGRTVRAKFAPSPGGTDWVAVSFEPVTAGSATTPPD